MGIRNDWAKLGEIYQPWQKKTKQIISRDLFWLDSKLMAWYVSRFVYIRYKGQVHTSLVLLFPLFYLWKNILKKWNIDKNIFDFFSSFISYF